MPPIASHRLYLLQTKGGTKMKQWEKSPSEILSKHLKDKKRPTLSYKNMEGRGTFRFRVILRDGKNQARDQVFVSSTVAKSEVFGKEEVSSASLTQFPTSTSLTPFVATK